jgi:hypothetical protein
MLMMLKLERILLVVMAIVVLLLMHDLERSLGRNSGVHILAQGQ